MAHAQDVALPLRDDVVTEPDRHALYQSVAPAVEDGLYLVPRGDRVKAASVDDATRSPSLPQRARCAKRSRASSSRATLLDAHRAASSRRSTRSSPSTPRARSPQAKAADAALAQGDARPLTGIPIAHKDVLMTAGLRTTCGSRMLAELRRAVRRARRRAACSDAGTVLVGKTNMDEFAMGSSSETSYFGPVRNPWNLDVVPGRQLGRLGGGGRRAPRARRHGHRHRRLDPPAGGAVGHLRVQADLRRVLALRPRRVRVEPRHAGRVRAHRGGLRAAAQRDGRPRRARLDLARPPARGLRAPARDRGAKPLAGLRIGLPAEYFGDGVDAGRRGGDRRARSRSSASSARPRSTSRCRTSSSRCRCTT